MTTRQHHDAADARASPEADVPNPDNDERPRKRYISIYRFCSDSKQANLSLISRQISSSLHFDLGAPNRNRTGVFAERGQTYDPWTSPAVSLTV
jgi:hypothetical protein